MNSWVSLLVAIRFATAEPDLERSFREPANLETRNRFDLVAENGIIAS